MPLETLTGAQNPDGGWPYRRGSSWTEPTAYAVLSLLGAGQIACARKGIAWLVARQRPDGSWPPAAGIDESAWVTAIVALVPRQELGAEVHRRAIGWLLGAQGEESTAVYRLREWLLGNQAGSDTASPGWPWVPGSAAWVGPTSLALLALAQEDRQRPSPQAQRRIAEGRQFLLNRLCRGGGWNHGSVRALGYESDPYPETTGMALAALHGATGAGVASSVAVALRFLEGCRSADALNWLRLGLLAHGQLPAGYAPPGGIAYRTVPENALDLLAAAAGRGQNVFGAWR